MTSSSFSVCLVIAERLLQFTVPLSQALQSESCDLVKATNNAAALVSFFERKREDCTTFEEIWKTACELAAPFDIAMTAPRTTKRQEHRSNAPSDIPYTYWRLNAFLPFIDHLIIDLKDRLCNAMPRIKAQHLLPTYVNGLSKETWQEIKVEYSSFMPASVTADSELEMWKHYISQHAIGEDLHAAVKETAKSFPNIHTILKILLTMPVSTSSVERSFNALRRLITYLRSTMGNDRLTGHALMHVHKDVDIDVDTKFDTGGCKISFLFEKVDA